MPVLTAAEKTSYDAGVTKLAGIAAGAQVCSAANVQAACAALASALAVNGQKITGLGTPTAATDAATMAYVDASVTVNATITKTGTLLGVTTPVNAANVITALASAASSVAVNSQKITGVLDGTAAQDAATFNMLRTVRTPTAVNNAASPYTLLAADEIVQVDSSTGVVSLQLPAVAGKRAFMIKDVGGAAATSNITLVRASTEKIENVAASKTLTIGYGSWLVWSDGTNWWISGSY